MTTCELIHPAAAAASTEIDIFVKESVVCGYHVYKEILSNVVDEELQCIHEIGNIYDVYAVKVVKAGMGTIGHLLKMISTSCHLFLQNGGSIGCTITGARQYSIDLPHGGLEIPCKLTFKGDRKLLDKLKQLWHKVPSLSPGYFSASVKQKTWRNSLKAKHRVNHEANTRTNNSCRGSCNP